MCVCVCVGGGGGALYNPDPKFSLSVAFSRSTPKSFFISIGLCPLLKTTTNVSVLYMLKTMEPGEVSRIATKCGAIIEQRPEQDVKVAPTECVARAITCGVQGLVLGPLVGFRGAEPPEALRF